MQNTDRANSVLLKKYLWGTFSYKRVMLSLIEIYILLCISGWFIADFLIHHPPSRKYGPLSKEISITTSDNIKLSAVWLTHPKATHTLLFSHGNGEDLEHDLPFISVLKNMGFNVLAYDYRGYGRSEGKPTEKGLYRDILAAYDYLVENQKIPSNRIIVLGRSLGSGPSTYLASEKKVGGLILESGFTSAFRVAVPFPLFPFDQFPNLKRFPKVQCPLLVIHGDKDTVIPISHGKKLYNQFQGAKSCLWVEGADHNDLFPTSPDLYLQAISTFAQQLKL
jgi:abhydrolase domain-containing protein 17